MPNRLGENVRKPQRDVFLTHTVHVFLGFHFVFIT